MEPPGVALVGGTAAGGLAIGVMGVVLVEAPLHMANLWVNCVHGSSFVQMVAAS